MHIHGVLMGAAIGDALGFSRTGMSRRRALHRYGRPPLRYRMVSMRGIYSGDTQLALLTAQALLKSRTDLRSFRRYFKSRLSWYWVSWPVGIGAATRWAALKCWFYRVGLPSGTNSADNGACVQAIFSALAINGTGHRLVKWTDETTMLTRTHPLALDGCRVLAVLAEAAATVKPDQWCSSTVLDSAIEVSTEPGIRDKLIQLKPFLAADRSPSFVARHFGWSDGITRSSLSTAVMGSYCFLRYPQNFQRAVGSAISLGGDSSSLGGVVGGLVGARVGVDGLPKDLARRLGGAPHGPAWISELAERFSHWPHGVDDLHRAPAQSVDPIGQIIRNMHARAVVWNNRLWRKFSCVCSRPRRERQR